MARKKTKAASRRRMRRWISTGAVTCSFIGFLVYLSNLPQPDTHQAINVFNRSSVEAHAKPTADAPAVQYTFYKDLPELKVLVKDVAENIPNRAQQVADTSTTTDTSTTNNANVSHEAIQTVKKDKLAAIPEKKKSTEKLAVRTKDKSKEQLALQTDAFSSLAEADHRRAELLLMGLNAHIEKVQSNGLTRYRVLVGPFAAKDTGAKMHSMLAQNNMNAGTLKQ